MIGVDEESGRCRQAPVSMRLVARQRIAQIMSADEVAGEVERFDPAVRTIVAARLCEQATGCCACGARLVDEDHRPGCGFSDEAIRALSELIGVDVAGVLVRYGLQG
jgi:hypothetical protein